MVRLLASCRHGQGNYYRRLASRLCGIAACTALASASIVGSGSMAFADTANTVQIIVIGQDGFIYNMTGIDSYHDQHVYDVVGNPIGTVDAYGNIIGSAGQQIGYIVLQ